MIPTGLSPIAEILVRVKSLDNAVVVLFFMLLANLLAIFVVMYNQGKP